MLQFNHVQPTLRWINQLYNLSRLSKSKDDGGDQPTFFKCGTLEIQELGFMMGASRVKWACRLPYN